MSRNTSFNIAIATVIGMSVIAIMLHAAANLMEANAPVEPDRFQVIDNYKGCDVVQYQRNGLAEYKYFLHCEK